VVSLRARAARRIAERRRTSLRRPAGKFPMAKKRRGGGIYSFHLRRKRIYSRRPPVGAKEGSE
jgi:hypothetical protein